MYYQIKAYCSLQEKRNLQYKYTKKVFDMVIQ